MNDEVKVGNLNKAVRRPLPKSAGADEAVAEATGSDDGIAELNKKVDKLLEFMQAIDWKMWVYLKANNYID